MHGDEGLSGAASAVVGEIANLRAIERYVADEATRLDRLAMALIAAHPGNLIPMLAMPAGCWAVLPAEWRRAREMSVKLVRGLPPRWIKGPIGIAVDVAERIIGG